MKKYYLTSFMFSALLLYSCNGSESINESVANVASTGNGLASVTSVVVSGEAGNYALDVTIESPDTGCNQYADWWEVVRPDGSLVYRRILAHSHVDEQPFTRSGSPVNIASDEEIIVRAHMNNSGYGGQVISGSIEQGLFANSLDTAFAVELETTAPLPDGCAF